MISNIEELKAELIARHIAYEDEMCGCSESEIQEIEAKYGKLPLSYRQIISLIGHSAGFLSADTNLYVSTNKDIDQVFYENESFLKYKREVFEEYEHKRIYSEEILGKEYEPEEDFLQLPDSIFIIFHWSNNQRFVLTDKKKNQQNSPVYEYSSSKKLTQKYSSVWEYIDHLVETSFGSFHEDRNKIDSWWLSTYRKPEYKESGETTIHIAYKNPDIVKDFIHNEETRKWFEAIKKEQQRNQNNLKIKIKNKYHI